MSAGAPVPPGGAEETATVLALTHDGQGIVREGKAVFIPGALPGERVRFRRVRRRRQHDEGKLLQVLESAAARVTPRCAHFGVCGGCALQHLAPGAQLALKETELRESLERVAHVHCDRWLAPLGGPVWGYRRRARLGAKYVVNKGRVVVGFRERLAPYVTDASHCDVLAAPVGEWLAPLSELIGALDIRAQVPQIEVAVAERAVALVLRVLATPTPADLARLREFAAHRRARIFLQPGGLDTVEPLAGTPSSPLQYELPQFGLRMEFAPTDFLQINAEVNRALVSRALELLAPTASSSVLDLYCGLGNLSLIHI